jgi:hypothetical protein
MEATAAPARAQNAGDGDAVAGQPLRCSASVEAGAPKVRRFNFKEFFDGAASWSWTERIIARVEVGPQGCRYPLHRHQSRNPTGVVSEDVVEISAVPAV